MQRGVVERGVGESGAFGLCRRARRVRVFVETLLDLLGAPAEAPTQRAPHPGARAVLAHAPGAGLLPPERAEDKIAAAAPDALGKITAKGSLGKERFVNAVKDFYLTNPIARASAVMAECSALAAGRMAVAAE